MGDMLAYEALQLKNLLAEEKVIKAYAVVSDPQLK